MELIIAAVLWYVLGVAAFMWWWAYEFGWSGAPRYDAVSQWPMALMVGGLLGPIAIPVGYFIHGRTERARRRHR